MRDRILQELERTLAGQASSVLLKRLRAKVAACPETAEDVAQLTRQIRSAVSLFVGEPLANLLYERLQHLEPEE